MSSNLNFSIPALSVLPPNATKNDYNIAAASNLNVPIPTVTNNAQIQNDYMAAANSALGLPSQL